MTGAFCVASTPVASNAKRNLPLYRLVHQGRLGTMAVLLLFVSFFMQGADLARANEESTETPQETAVEVVEENPSSESESEAVIETVDLSVSDSQNAAEEDDIDAPVLEDEQMTDSSEEMSEEGSENIDSVDSESVSETTPEESIDSEVDDSSLSEEEGIEVPDDEDDIYITAENATSSEVVSEVVAVAYSDDSFSFNKAECTELASGSFYCQKPQEDTLDDALFAARDADGDLEIYLVRDGIEQQVTANQIDDAAPFYDQNSDTIVWHRLIDDRYQIVAYDVETGKEEVLTKTAENNMEPNRQGRYTVWQRWVDGGWNIILHDGTSETQITKTTSHNVAPYIHGALVVWNRHDQVNDRTIEMYDMATETYVSIEDPEGMSVANPRMVFVYDSVRPNGDIVTKGYDMLARKFIDLDTLPRNLPEDIPASESTGETRALIQNKPSGKSELEELTGTGTGTDTGIASTTGATTSLTETLSSTSSIPALDLTDALPVLTEPEVVVATDLVIPALDREQSNESPSEIVVSEPLPDLEEVVEFVFPE